MKLPVQITFKNMAEDGLEEYVRQQAFKLERYYDGIMSCDILVETRGRHLHGNPYHVRIRLGMPDGELVVKHEPSLHATLQDQETGKAAKRGEGKGLPKNPRRAILDAFAEMRRRVEDYARKRRGQTKQHEAAPSTGTVVRLFPAEGYGFLKSQDGDEIFFHSNSVLEGGFNQLRVGSDVRFDAELGEKGPQATSVHVVHPRKQARTAAASVVMERPARRTK